MAVQYKIQTAVAMSDKNDVFKGEGHYLVSEDSRNVFECHAYGAFDVSTAIKSTSNQNSL